MAELKKISQLKLTCEIISASGIVLFVLGMLTTMANANVGGFITFVIGLAMASIPVFVFKPAAVKFKDKYVKQAINELGIDASFHATYGFTKEEVKNSRAIQLQTRFTSEDLVSGVIDDRAFRFSDIHIEQRRSSGKSSHYVTTFKGRLFEIASDKTAKLPVYIFPNNRKYLPLFSSEKKIELESIKFNQAFDVYSSDEHTAFYVITPRLMERIHDLNAKYEKLSISYIGNKLYVAVDTRIDYFQIALFKPIEEHFIEEFKKDILEIRSIIKTLS